MLRLGRQRGLASAVHASGIRYSAQAYYFLYNAAIVFILPYLAVLWKDNGFSGSQIGILSALRPFICSISGQLLVGYADAHGVHRWVMLVTYVLTLATRSSMALASAFVAHVLLIAVSESCQSPFSIIADATIAANTDYGIPISIAVYLGLVITALVPTALLPVGVLSRKKPTEAETAGTSAAAAWLGRTSATPLLSALASNDDGPICNSSNRSCYMDTSGSGIEERHHGGGAAEHALELAGSIKALPDLEAGRGPDCTLSPRKLSIAASTLLDEPDPRDGDAWLISAPRGLLPSTPGLAASGEAVEDATIHGLVTRHGGARCWDASGSTALQQGSFCTDTGGNCQTAAAALEGGGTGGSTRGGAGAAGGQGCGATLDRVSSLATTEFFSVHSSYSALDRLTAGTAAASPRGCCKPAGPLWRQRSDASVLFLESTIHEGSVLAGDALLLSPRAPGLLSPPRWLSTLGMPPAGLEDCRGISGRGELALASPPAASTRTSGDGDPLVLKASGTAAAVMLNSTAAGSSDGPQLHRRLSSRRLLPPLLSKPRSMSEGNSAAESTAISLSSPKELSRQRESVAAGPSWPCGSSSALAPASQAELGVWAGIRQVLSDPHGAAFFATALNMGLAYGVQNFLMLLLTEQGAPGLLLGICLTVNSCAEIMAFNWSHLWLARLGPEAAFHLAQGVWCLRLGLYCLVPFMPTPWLVLPVELLQGFTFAMACVGPGFSGLAAGLLMAATSLRRVFLVGSLACAGLWAATLGALWLATRGRRRGAAVAGAQAAWTYEI